MKRRATRFAARFIPHNSYLIPFPFAEPKPQQTGTGLLIRLGEVATTSGSTNSTASWCNSSMLGFDPYGLGANPSEAAKQFSPGGEIASRLAYTQKSRGQNLPGRPPGNAE